MNCFTGGFKYFAKIFIHKKNLQQNSQETSVNKFIFSKAAGLESATLLKTELLSRCLSRI